MLSVIDHNNQINESIFSSITVQPLEMIDPQFYPTVHYSDPIKKYELTFTSSKIINNHIELEYIICDEYFKKRFGFSLDRLKENYPELFLI